MHHRWSAISLITGLLLWSGVPAQAQLTSVPTVPRFRDVSAQVGIGSYSCAIGMGAGVAAADYDSDGDVDFYVPNGQGGTNQLYENLGNGQFQEVAAARGLAFARDDRAALWFDSDSDGLIDLLMTNDVVGAPSNFHLYRQQPDGSFVDATADARLSFRHNGSHTGGLAAGDIDNDGDLDLYVAMWNTEFGIDRSALMENQNGQFVTINTTAFGTASRYPTQFQPMFLDFNGDGFLDLYIAVDFHPNYLYVNQGDKTFVDVAGSAGAAQVMNDMGLAVGDYDNDGDFDLYTTNIFVAPDKYNVLLRNDSVGSVLQFTDVSKEAGVDYGGWGWGATLADFNCDGFLDIAATNGWVEFNWGLDETQLYLQRAGRGRFDAAGGAAGVDDRDWGSSLLAVDYDLDGDPDLVQTCNEGGPFRVLRNQGYSGNSLRVRTRMDAANHRAIGATVKATYHGRQLLRLISAGTSWLGQEPAEALLGVGLAQAVDLRVEFPDGTVSELDDVAVGQTVTVYPPPVTRFDLRHGDVLAGDERGLRDEAGPSLTIGSAPLVGDYQMARWEADLVSEDVISGDFELRLRSSASHPSAFARVSLWDWGASRWRAVGFYRHTSDLTTRSFASLTPSTFVDSSQRLRVQVRSVAELPGGQGFSVVLDHVEVVDPNRP